MKNIHKSLRNLSVLLCSLLYCSCGLIDMEFDPETNQVKSITFAYDTVYAMVSDTFFLAPYMYPDSLSSTSIAWGSEDNTVVKCINDTILGRSQGWTRVFATTFANNRSDTCTVCIMPRWEVSAAQYLYDMVVYAHILLDGKVPAKTWLFGAFDEDGEPRGMAVAMNEERTIYRFRVWNALNVNEEDSVRIDFFAYNKQSLQKYQFQTCIYFAEDAVGTPSHPLELSMQVPLPPNRNKDTKIPADTLHL